MNQDGISWPKDIAIFINSFIIIDKLTGSFKEFCASLVILHIIKVVIHQTPSLKRQYVHQQNLTIPNPVKSAFNTIPSPSTMPAAQFAENLWRLQISDEVPQSTSLYTNILLSCASVKAQEFGILMSWE